MDEKLQAKKFFIESAKSDLLLKTAKSEWMETARPKTKRHHNFFLTSQSGRDVNLIQQEICVDKILKSAQENSPFDKKVNSYTIHIKHILYAPSVHRQSGREVHNWGLERGKHSSNYP